MRISFTLLVFLLGITTSARVAAQVAKLDIRFLIKEEVKGNLYIGIYDSEQAFMKTPQAKYKQIIAVDKADMLVSITDLPPGTYAVSCFQDVNDNKKLDKNMVGIPSEPYGFSNNARPSFRAPTWGECTFNLPAGGKQIEVKVQDWW